jgi:hypothetical protein
MLAGGSVFASGRVLAQAGAQASGASAQLASSGAVVAFFDGQLWLDTSGASSAYRAPTAARAMPSFTDEELVRARGYL